MADGPVAEDVVAQQTEDRDTARRAGTLKKIGSDDNSGGAMAELPKGTVAEDCTSSEVVQAFDVGGHPSNAFDNVLPLTRNRNGTWWSTMVHNITAMIGAGILDLPHTFIYLGWVGGPIVLVAACWISWYTFWLLVMMHEQVPKTRTDMEETGGAPKPFQRMNRYIELSRYALGQDWGWIIQPFQIALLWGTSITYTVTGGTMLDTVYKNYTDVEDQSISLSIWMVIFGGVSIFIAQISNFGDLMLVSAMGAVMSVSYSIIAVVVSAKFPLEPRDAVVWSTGDGLSTAGVTFGTFSALTSVMFAFGGHNIAMEIQASLPGGTSAADSTVAAMMPGVHATFTLATVLYFSVAFVGWWAFGVNVKSNVLLSLGGPKWVQTWACLMVFMHVLASFQVYSFPLYDMIESRLLTWNCTINWWRRIIIRTVYVVITVFIACLLPFFGQLMGLVGAVGITPTTYVYPCILWLIINRPPVRSFHFWMCLLISISMSCVGILGAIGSVRQIVVSASNYKVFS